MSCNHFTVDIGIISQQPSWQGKPSNHWHCVPCMMHMKCHLCGLWSKLGNYGGLHRLVKVTK